MEFKVVKTPRSQRDTWEVRTPSDHLLGTCYIEHDYNLVRVVEYETDFGKTEITGFQLQAIVEILKLGRYAFERSDKE